MTPTTTTAPTRVGRVARWKLTEPVRFYQWPVAGLLLVAAVVAGIQAGDWWRASVFAAAAVLILIATSAARASVYSPRSLVQTLLRQETNR